MTTAPRSTTPPRSPGKRLVAIIDYGSGNLHSVSKAFEAVASRGGHGDEITITRAPDIVRKASHLVLPGVGAFADCKRGINALPGLLSALEEAVVRGGKPFLGICVGMQLMATRGLEYETTQGFDWMAGDVVRLAPNDPACKVPHMGWNTLDIVRPHPLLEGLDEAAGSAGGADGKPIHAYFVHSYHFVPQAKADIVATTFYDGARTAIVARDNMVGVQFHPEKSQAVGLKLLDNFLGWCP